MIFDKILILVAMEKEALPLVQILKLKIHQQPLDPSLPAKTFYSKTEQGEIFLVMSGKCPHHQVDRIGSQGLNLVAWEAVKTYTPNLIVNIGTAGGFQTAHAKPGDIYISSETIKYHDRLFYPDLVFQNYGIGNYKCLEIPLLAQQLQLKQGIISTGGSLIASENEKIQMKKNNASVKDMEAAGIAEIAQLKNIPFIALKIITDLVDIEDCPQNQFERNFETLIHSLANKAYELCNVLLGRNLQSFV
jgi:5'-methylthioadenosine nucleosidase